MSAPNAPCKDCSLHRFGCRTNCQGWNDYLKAKEEWTAIVKAEKSRYLNITDAEIKRKSKEKRKKERRERR